MTVTVDEKTGYLIIDGLEEGVEILPTTLYQSYLQRIKDLEAEVSSLKDKCIDLSEKSMNIQEKMLDNWKEAIRSERNVGIALGIFMRTRGIPYELAKYYYDELSQWYLEAEEAGQLPIIEEKARNRLVASNDIIE